MAESQRDYPSIQADVKVDGQVEQGGNGTTEKTLSWYRVDIGDKLSDQAKKLLEEYGGIAPEEVERHVYAVRDAAWKIWPYPCIGQFNFLDLSISQSPQFKTILSRLKSSPSQTLLDLGCCFGQDIRVLVSAGVPSQNLYASDIESSFWDIGYDLFNDKSKLKTVFIPADILSFDSDANNGLRELRGKMDIIHIASFLHLFDLELQTQACVSIVELLRTVAGSLVVGRQVGSVVPGERERLHSGNKMYRHNEASFKEMWRVVGEKTGTKWRVEVEVLEREGRGRDVKNWNGGQGDQGREHVDEVRRLRFAVFREE